MKFRAYFCVINYLLLIFCIKVCFSSNEIEKVCETLHYENFYTTTCFKNNSDDFSYISKYEKWTIVCSKNNTLDVHYLNDKKLFFAKSVELENCSLKSRLFGSLNLSSVESFLSLPGTQNCVLHNNSFEGLCSSKLIKLSRNYIKIIDTTAFACIKDISDLDLSHNKVKSLPSLVFKGMRKLLVLHLNDNNLKSLPEGLFNDLESLLMLYLHSNSISYLPDTIFQHLSFLRVLSLSTNDLAELNENILSNLNELRQLDISSNKIKYLINAFSNNNKLKKLVMSQNKGLLLLNNSLTGLFELTDLHLNECNITSLPTGLFENMESILSLFMYNNRLKVINSLTFGDLKRLQVLDLSFNDVNKLNDRPFRNNRFLETIRLRKNNLSELKKDNFQGLSSLIILDISSNFIKNIDSDTFDNLPKLFSLNISGNFITSLSGLQPFGNSEWLSKIDVSYNCLSDIKNAYVSNLLSLEEFWATHNKISQLHIPSFISESPKMHLEWNQIRRIHLSSTNVIKNNNLTSNYKAEFYLTGNPLDCDCHAYELYKYINNLRSSRIVFPDGLFCQNPVKHKGKNLHSLKPTDFTCNIADNCPKRCECTYKISDNMKIVNCSSKNYEDLPQNTPHNTSILDISKNNLTSLVSLKNNIWKNLTEIHAENNMIESPDFDLPVNVKLLTLSGNKLRIFPDAIQKHSDAIKSFKITISNNLWPCNCSVLPFKKWLSKHITQVSDINDVHCIYNNSTQSITNLISIKEIDLCSYFEYALYIVSFGLIFLTASLMIFYYRHKIYFVSYMYSHCNYFYLLFCCDSQIEEEKLYDCFISYSSTDREVTLAILDKFENRPPYYKFCIHERNWLPGRYITNNIVDSVKNSRKTLIIISEAFLKSEWFYMEFQAAYYQMLQDKKDRLIVILKGKLPDKNELDRDVLQVISTKTYLQWEETWFWEKLSYSFYQQNISFERKRKSKWRKLLKWNKTDDFIQEIPLTEET